MNHQPLGMTMVDGGPAAYFGKAWTRKDVASWLLRYRGEPMCSPNALKDSQGIRYHSFARAFDERTGALLLYSREIWPPLTIAGAGTKLNSYWRHLSLSFHETDIEAGPDRYGRMREPKPADRKTTELWIEAFFGCHQRYVLAEPPLTDRGRKFDVWHYRLPCFAETWEPLGRRGLPWAAVFESAGWTTFDGSVAAARAADRGAE